MNYTMILLNFFAFELSHTPDLNYNLAHYVCFYQIIIIYIFYITEIRDALTKSGKLLLCLHTLYVTDFENFIY